MKSSPAEAARLFALAGLAADRADELLGELGVDARRTGRMFQGCCPVHGGDNTTAWNLYPDGHTVRGNWTCRTRNCQRTFHPTLVGFVRGVLSHREHGWDPDCGPDRRVHPFRGAVDWLCRFVGVKWEHLRVDAAADEQNRFLSKVATLAPRRAPAAGGWTRDQTRGRLVLPSPYFVGRGFDPALLDRLDVGDSRVADPAHPMYRRAVVPVYDPAGARVVGVTARSTWPRCPGCGRWHEPGEACNARPPADTAKWRNSPGFAREHHLYGLADAREEVRRTGRVLLLEGPPDVWACRAAACRVGVGLFGVVLTDPQQVLLESLPISEVVVGTNGDAAGRQAAFAIADQLRRAFRVTVADVPGKDLAELDGAALRDWLKAYKLVPQESSR